jgi:hypothetical protein
MGGILPYGPRGLVGISTRFGVLGGPEPPYCAVPPNQTGVGDWACQLTGEPWVDWDFGDGRWAAGRLPLLFEVWHTYWQSSYTSGFEDGFPVEVTLGYPARWLEWEETWFPPRYERTCTPSDPNDLTKEWHCSDREVEPGRWVRTAERWVAGDVTTTARIVYEVLQAKPVLLDFKTDITRPGETPFADAKKQGKK